MRAVFTLDGAFSLFGQDWSWKAYAQNSNVREVERMPYNTIAQNYSNATDPVTVTGTGPDSTRRRQCGAGGPSPGGALRGRRGSSTSRSGRLSFSAHRNQLGHDNQPADRYYQRPSGGT